MEIEKNKVKVESVFTQRMKQYRDETGLNQQEVADKIGVKRAAYAHYESGARQPGFGFLCDFSTLSGWSPSYLLGLSEYKTLDQEADAAQLVLGGDAEAAAMAAEIRQTAKNLLDHYNSGKEYILSDYLEPLARIADQVNKVQKCIKGCYINEDEELIRVVTIDFYDYFRSIYAACNDLLKGFNEKWVREEIMKSPFGLEKMDPKYRAIQPAILPWVNRSEGASTPSPRKK